MIDKIKENKLLIQIFRFGIVGGISFVIDYGVLVFCKELLHFSVFVSTALGFCISVVFNYIISIKWVFDVKEDNSQTKSFVLFIIFSILGLVLTEIIMYLGTNMLNVSYLIVKIIATSIVMVFNFVTRKIFLE